MSTMEQRFIEAIKENKIESVVIEGRSAGGKSYSFYSGDRTLLDGSKKPLSSKDILFLASATKLLATVATLQCCDRKQLDLDADLATRLPGVKDLGVLVESTAGSDKITTEPLRKPITLRHLLTHSSGFVYEFFSLYPALQSWREKHPRPWPAGVEGIPARHTVPLAFQPGDGWMYGPGVDWAGYLVEEVSGMKLDEYIRKNILEPLGIPPTEVSFFPVKEGLGERMPDLNPKDPEGRAIAVTGTTMIHDEKPGTCYGGGGAYATAGAYVAVLQSLLLDDGKLLGHEAVEEMFKPSLEPKARENLDMWLGVPKLGVAFAQCTDSANRNWGLGGLLVTEGGDRSGLGKGAMTWGGGHNSAWIIDPANGVCGFTAPQLAIPPDPVLAMEIKGMFKKELKGQLENVA